MTVAGLPKFTVSFGVVEVDPKDDLPTTLSRADAALAFQAKHEGRDRVVVLDALGHEIPVAAGGPTESPSTGNGRVLNGRGGRDALDVSDVLSS